MLSLKSHYFPTQFGKLHYLAPDKTSNEVMLFLHGFGSNANVWKPLLEASQQAGYLKNCDSLLIDLPNFGKSENKLRHLNSPEVGNELIRLCHELGYKTIRVTGHSMGSFLTLDMASRHPDIASIHIIAGGYFRIIEISQKPFKSLFKYPKLTLIYSAQYLLSAIPGLASMINKAVRRFFRSEHPVYEVTGRAFIYAARNGRGYDPYIQWAKIKAKIYGVYGSNDPLVTAYDQNQLQSVQPNATLTMLEDANHSLVVKRPVDVAKAIYSEL